MTARDPAESRTWTPYQVRITVRHGRGAPAVFDGVPLPATVGRGREADLQLVDDAENPTISRCHLVLAMRGARLVVEDLGSSNGTRVGGVLLVPKDPALVEDGTPIWLGQHTMITAELIDVGAGQSESLPVPAAPPPLLAPDSSVLAVRTLGSVGVELDGRSVTDRLFQRRKTITLLVYLLLAGRPQDPDHLCEVIWPDAEAPSRATLQSTVSRLRKALLEGAPTAPDPIVLVHNLYSINPLLHVELDARRFEELCSQAREQRSADLLQQAMHQYHGPFLSGFSEEWIDVQRARLDALYLEALEATGARCEEEERIPEAIRYYEVAVSVDPCRETAHAGLCRCYASSGRRDDAVRQCLECARILRKRLHLAPGPEILAMYRKLVGEGAAL